MFTYIEKRIVKQRDTHNAFIEFFENKMTVTKTKSKATYTEEKKKKKVSD